MRDSLYLPFYCPVSISAAQVFTSPKDPPLLSNLRLPFQIVHLEATASIVRSNRTLCGRRLPLPALPISFFTFLSCFLYTPIPALIDIFITPLNRVPALLLYLFLLLLYTYKIYRYVSLYIVYNF